MWAAHAKASSWCEGSSECSEGGGAPEQPTLKGTPPTRSSRPESTYMMGLAGSPGALVITCTAEKSSGRRWSTPAARGASRRPWSRWCRLRPREASWSAGNAPCRGRLRPGVQNSQWPVFNDQSAVREGVFTRAGQISMTRRLTGWTSCKRTSTGHSVFTVKLPCGCR